MILPTPERVARGDWWWFVWVLEPVGSVRLLRLVMVPA